MVSEEDIAEFGDLWSLMYFVFAKEMVDSFGEEGEEALRRAIRSYGRARGLRLRKRHEEQGLPINLRSLFEHYDLPGHPGTEKTRTVFEDDELVSFTYVCPYERIWRARDGAELGLVYCQEFHHAMWQAYRPDLEVEIPEMLTKDDPHCKFVVTQPNDA
ncbi:MAG: L-2-amino-thiazoline-4-carboxylic acid hydrolase [Candidatus Bathyarchaeota archaeon]|nr:L-2-amino-thiazoline-4-carboxylic acid hydrolase [Candidatus Bathyarchaeota archaeon]